MVTHVYCDIRANVNLIDCLFFFLQIFWDDKYCLSINFDIFLLFNSSSPIFFILLFITLSPFYHFQCKINNSFNYTTNLQLFVVWEILKLILIWNCIASTDVWFIFQNYHQVNWAKLIFYLERVNDSTLSPKRFGFVYLFNLFVLL